MKIIRDPVHGDIALSDEELRIVDTPQFQRLRGIRQLGTSYLVFPGAVHNRFEHSLGTCWLAKRMIDEINHQSVRAGLPPTICQDEARLLGFAALLHDITHIPFGHTFEDERRILPPHDDSAERLKFFLDRGELGHVLVDLGVRDQLFRLFTVADKNRYDYQLIAGPICADLLDYLKRDAYFCGLNMAYDDRIFSYLRVEGDHLCFNLYNDRGFRQDVWSELIHLLRIRYHLTERVYFHHGKVASGAMLSRLLEALLAAKAFQAEELYTLRDDAFVFLVEQRIAHIPQFKPLLQAFLARRLYKRVYMVARHPLDLAKPGDQYMERFQREFHLNERGARNRLERRLAKHLGIPESAVILYAPETDMRLKEARVNVRIDAGPLRSLSHIHHPELEGLRNRHRAIWRFFLFMDPAYEDKFVKASRFMEREIGLPNQLELSNKGQLTLGFGS